MRLWDVDAQFMQRRWYDLAAERLRVVISWPHRCNNEREREVLESVKRLEGGRPMWLIQARVQLHFMRTANAIARGHQR